MSDLIKRDDVLDAICDNCKLETNFGRYMACGNCKDVKMIMAIPSVDRPRGKWDFIGDNMFRCTSCGELYTTQQLNRLRNYDTDPYAPKFCPSCGADMRGDDDEDN